MASEARKRPPRAEKDKDKGKEGKGKGRDKGKGKGKGKDKGKGDDKTSGKSKRKNGDKDKRSRKDGKQRAKKDGDGKEPEAGAGDMAEQAAEAGAAEAGAAAEPISPSAKAQVTFGEYWKKVGGAGNQFLRSALGGTGVDGSEDEWEFTDVAGAFAVAKIKGIQYLYDMMAPDILIGATYTELADKINISERVYLIPMLLRAFDDAVGNGTLKPWTGPVGSDADKQGAGHDAENRPKLAEYMDVSIQEEKDDADSDSEPSVAHQKAKGWNELKHQAGVQEGKQKSSACTIL